ncbi:hypothetical protein FACS1894180_8280 [Bacteroidia bacterium]|nr:hypothetical protein FACS1894180_8280 [Bacteroidia bacterium]
MLALNAQDAPKSFDSSASLDKKTSGACVSINVNADVKTAMNVMENLLKKEGLKGAKKKGKTLQFEKTVFPTISTDYVNLYFGFVQASKDKKNPKTTVNVFVSKGIVPEFLTAATDAQLNANLKNFLDTKYAPAMYNDNVEKLKEAKQKEIDKTKSELDNLGKNIEKRTKDISGYEKDIEKAKKDIETSKKQTETTKALLQKQQDELKEIK